MANNQQLHPLTTATAECSNCDKNVTIQTASVNANQLEVNVLGASLPTNTFLLSPTYGLCSIDQKSVRPLNVACSSISSANKTVGACFVASNGLPLNGESAAAGSDDCISPPLTTDGLLNLIPLQSQQDGQSRFRVVKIESSELLLQRGRWTCVNFSDSAASSVSRGRVCDWLHDDVGYSSGSSMSSSGHCGGGVYPLLCVLSDGESPVGRLPAHVNKADTEIVCPPMQSLSTSDLLPAAESAYTTEVAWLTGPTDGRYGLDIDKIRAPLAVITHLDPDNNVNLGNNDDAADGGASAVAIDNKIEQAMDLVKSHLMFAVREEVEVLKEQIKFLMERNEHLEHENSILRAAASRETLDMLNSRQPPLT